MILRPVKEKKKTILKKKKIIQMIIFTKSIFFIKFIDEINLKKKFSENKDDEILARQLQEEFDQEYAASLELNIENKLDYHNGHQEIDLPQFPQDNNVNNSNNNNQMLNFGLNVSQRSSGNNSRLVNELSIFQNHNFVRNF